MDAKIDTKSQVLDLCFKRAPWHKKDETVLIGDTKFDCIGANTVGIDCIGITWGSGTRDDFEEHMAIAICDEPEEVLDYIELH